MDPQISLVKCKQHPQRPVSFLYCKQDCPYVTRLGCNQCVLKYQNLDGFVEIQDVLNNPRTMLKANNQSEFTIYDWLTQYFDLLEQDPEEFISFFKKGILQQIEKLEQDLKEGIEKYKLFRAELIKARQQFDEAVGYKQFKQAFKDILQAEGYHYGQEWNKLEDTVQKFISQFNEQNNQQLWESLSKVQSLQGDFFSPIILSDFKEKSQKRIDLVNNQFTNCGLIPKFPKSYMTSFCEPTYFFELIRRIQSKKDTLPKISLIFKGTEHGMNGEAFYQKCSNQGRTLIICKSKSGDVFGGYTPCQWDQKKNAYLVDETNTTFLFSCTRKEIYPNIKGTHAIWTGPGYGPYFGNGTLNISTNFQSGSCPLNNGCFSLESYKIENASTHLMGSTTPQLVEMEVFRID